MVHHPDTVKVVLKAAGILLVNIEFRMLKKSIF